MGGRADVRTFFDAVARDYRERHGNADRLFRYRLRVLRQLLPPAPRRLLVEIGCGPGQHLLALAAHFDRAVGLDLSPAMIERAEQSRQTHALRERIAFAVDPAEELATLATGTADAVICVGAFEHLLQQDRALAQIRRVLQARGRFVCLTPNGGYLWYTRWARALGCEIRHLSTDRFLTLTEFRALLSAEGFTIHGTGYWRFIPRGDMPPAAAALLGLLDRLGSALRIPALRGGLFVVASPTE